MNRDTRMWIVVGIAVLTAAIATYGIYRFIPRPLKEAPKVFVVVAKKALEMGSTVAEADVKLIAWPNDSQIAGAFTSIDQVKGKSLVAAVLENEPVTKSKLAEKGFGLPILIHDGMRAMSVKVNEVIGVAGFVTPGTRVDVLVTIRQDQNSMSKVVVQNVEVLTAGAKYDDPEGRKQGKPIPSTFVTLMVSPEQAERIALAVSEGQIMLVLRNPLDKVQANTSGVTIPDLVGGRRPVPPPPPPRRQDEDKDKDKDKDKDRDKDKGGCTVETFKAGIRQVLPCT
jgi:pilus assembly protein CpaB